MFAGESASPRVAESISSCKLPEFEVQDTVRDGEHTLVLRGELDLNSAPLLSVTLRLICAEPATSGVVLDLSRLTFMDSTGIHALLLTKELCAERGSQFFVVPGESQVRRVLQITGLLGQLPVREPHGDGGARGHDGNHGDGRPHSGEAPQGDDEPKATKSARLTPPTSKRERDRPADV
jgi:anti-sigma B factor antagonist